MKTVTKKPRRSSLDMPRDVGDGRAIQIMLARGDTWEKIAIVFGQPLEELQRRVKAAEDYTELPPVHESNLP